MALYSAALPGMLRGLSRRMWPGLPDGRECMCSVTPVCSFQDASSCHVRPHRALHVSSAMSAKNLLKKFASKTKKKFWYDSPSLGTHFVKKPDSLLSLMKVQKKEHREDSIRMRTLNSILHKTLTDLLRTPEISNEIYNLNLELSKVSITADFSACRAYWITCGDVETDDQAEKVLTKSAPQFRHHLLTHQVLGSVPPIVFVRDKENAMIQEVERLLAMADFGEDYKTPVTQGHDEIRELGNVSMEAFDTSTEVPPSPTSSLFGIDHANLNRQILDYKHKMRDHETESDFTVLSQHQQEQLAEIRKQKILKKKMKKLKAKLLDDDITPQRYLMEKYNALNRDIEASSEHIELESEDLTTDQQEEVDEERTHPQGDR
ncbi:ribosome-binding factor A, mitochondrial [Pelobates cultripes]|uniref:Ribosome-binding factor A, mitochondrial n=1 Tax=Pelobates cultripes TaxID=61616 RepID=A0AAD1W1A5_PELCU|nr:ribosome-binding factor A, mitochondrial [Pelobates cultripes]